MIPERHVRVEAIAWLAAIVPFVAANAAYLISASADLVPWCVPYLEGCTSVSRAARTGIASPVFRGLIAFVQVCELQRRKSVVNPQ